MLLAKMWVYEGSEGTDQQLFYPLQNAATNYIAAEREKLLFLHNFIGPMQNLQSDCNQYEWAFSMGNPK